MYRIYDWKMLYSMTVHGISLPLMYRKTKGCSPTILLIRDSFNNAFGVFITEPLKESLNYYGSGEMFLFTFKVPHCSHIS